MRAVVCWLLFFGTAKILLLAPGHSQLFAKPPNVLVAISDDQSYPHASAYGASEIETPGFDQVALDGMLFHNAFTPAPGCSPMRAAFLTGQYIWQLREAGTHASSFPNDLAVFPSELEKAGYRIGYTGKPWGPGNYKISGWDQNPAGPAFNKARLKSPKGISSTDYATNFQQFLEERDEDEPFCFWFGGHEPHRGFGKGLGTMAGINLDKIEVPAFLPDCDEVRSDLADYFYEIQWFDQHLQRMLKQLEQSGELENTLVIVTSDNGMSFPRAKANLYEYGIHMPLAISWPAAIEQGGSTRALVNLIDVTATIYDACEVQPPTDHALSGNSLLPLLKSSSGSQPDSSLGAQLESRPAVFSGRERHSSSRYNSLGYPCRCVRTKDFLYIRNFAAERWPAGTPQKFKSVAYTADGQAVRSELGPPHGGYHDIDACPTLDWMIRNQSEPDVQRLFQAAVAIRPSEELYSIANDAACLNNLAADPDSATVLQKHRNLLERELSRTNDLRLTDFEASQIWETYPRYSSLRWFPEPAWAKQQPLLVPRQDWLEAKRPRAK